MPNLNLLRPPPRRRGLLMLAAILTIESLTPTAAAQTPATTSPAPVAAPATASDLDSFAARLHDADDDDLDALWEEADALVDAHPHDPHAVELRRWTRERVLRRTLPMLTGRLEDRLITALAAPTPGVDYVSLAAHLDAIVEDLAQQYTLENNERLQDIRNTRAVQARRAHEYAESPQPPAARALALKPSRPQPQPQPQIINPPAKKIPRPNSPLIGNILGAGFAIAGAATVIGGSVLLSESVFTKADAHLTQHIQPASFATGAALAFGGATLLGGGTSLLVSTAVTHDPGKRRPIRQASWTFLASAGAFAAASTYFALDALHQRNQITIAEDGHALDDSNLGYNRAAILGGLALSQLGIFAGMHAATRERDANTGRAYSVRPIPPSIGFSRGGASATVGFRF